MALELTVKAQALEGRGTRGILNLRNGISRGFQEVFSTVDAVLFHQNTHKTGNKFAIAMSQAFHNIAWFARFIDLNLFKYAFSVIQHLEMDAL